MFRRRNRIRFYAAQNVASVINDYAAFEWFVIQCVNRHLRKDWGDVSIDQRDANNAACENEGRVFSLYAIPEAILAHNAKLAEVAAASSPSPHSICVVTQPGWRIANVMFSGELYQPVPRKSRFLSLSQLWSKLKGR